MAATAVWGLRDRAAGYDQSRPRRWRHLGLGRLRVEFAYAPCRVDCSRCQGVRVEAVPWAPHGSAFTHDFEELVAYLAQVTDKTRVTQLMGIAWSTVGAIVRRVVDRKLAPDLLEGLRCTGVDEFAYRKRHNYLTVVVDHDRKRVVWTAAGHDAATLQGFFQDLRHLEWVAATRNPGQSAPNLEETAAFRGPRGRCAGHR